MTTLHTTTHQHNCNTHYHARARCTCPKYVVVRIAEPFPVFYSHSSQECRRANDPRTQGPFCVAGSEFFMPNTDANVDLAERQADLLRADGYTVTIELR